MRTEGEWEVYPERSCNPSTPYDSKILEEIDVIGYIYEEEKAKHIVKCVNRHDELVEMVREYRRVAEAYHLGKRNIDDIDAVLPKAGEEEP